VVEWGVSSLSEFPVRHPLVVFATCLALGAPAAVAAPAAAPKPAAKPSVRPAAPAAKPTNAPTPTPPAVPAPVAEQLAHLKTLERAQLRPAYAEAQLELARRWREAGDARQALTAAMAASKAFDRQVEAHKALSEVLTPYERARAERAAAHDLGVQRDRANFLVGELARAAGDDDTAITHYVLVIQSQPDQPLGQDAMAALVAMGFSAPAPSPTPKP
jgi:hypothetical protein